MSIERITQITTGIVTVAITSSLINDNPIPGTVLRYQLPLYGYPVYGPPKPKGKPKVVVYYKGRDHYRYDPCENDW